MDYIPTSRQYQDFIDATAAHTALDDAIMWISENLAPEWVFSETALEQWASENGYKRVED